MWNSLKMVVRDLSAKTGEGVPSADAHRMSLAALRAEPADDLVVGDDERPGTLGDRDGVADVVGVAMADQDRVELVEIARMDVGDGTADLTVTGSYEYDAGTGRMQTQPVSFRASAALEAGAWKLRTVR